MKRIILAVILVTVFITVNVHSSSAQSPEQLYQKGLTKEEGEGALQDAISLYYQVADNSSASISLRAKALMHVGMCYEKLGTKEAVKAYQRLLASFPTQKNEVAYARERLTRLSPIAVKVSDAILIPKFTKIKMPTNPGNGILSPDGKKVAFILDGCVWTIPASGGVDPLIAGEPKKLTDNIGAWDNINSFAWSGDGKWIAVNAELKSSGTSIYVVPSEGGKPQKVQVPSHNCNRSTEFRLSLSPDGKILAYATGSKTGDYQTKSTRIYTIPVNGGTPKELTEPGTQEPAFSPDGSKIAYIKYTKNNEGQDQSDLWVILSQGGTPKQITSIPSLQIYGPSWSPDGKMIAFIRRAGYSDPKEIWIAPVTSNGSPSAPPTKVDLPLASYCEVAGWTSDNKIGLQLMNPEYEIIYTVNSSGGIATQITPQGWTEYPKWSPDGKRIFFRGDRGKIAYVPSGGGAVDSIPIQSEYTMLTAAPGSGNDISPDGKTIVFSGGKYFYKDGERKWDVNIYTIPVEGGKPKQLTTIAVELQDRFPCWSPDGNSIAFIRPEIINGNYIMHIFTISKEGNNLRQLTTESDSVAWAPIDWAPDGKSIAYFSKTNSIRFMPVEGGKSRFLTEVDTANSQFELAWSPDGKELAYTDKGKIWKYSKESGETKELKTGVAERATKLGWSPDGKKIAFTAYGGGDNELWLMENFLPLEKLAQKNEQRDTKGSTEIIIRQVFSDLDYSSSVSTDGENIAFADWATGNLAVRNIKTGENKLVTNDGTWLDSMQYAEHTLISPNGKQVAYQWINKKGICEIRLIKLDSPVPTVLYTGVIDDYITPELWFPDGRKIVFQKYNSKNRISQLFSVNTGTNEVQLLKENAPGPYLQANLSLSPDNRFIAFDFPNPSDQQKCDINLLSIENKDESQLIKHPANDRLLGWLPGKNEFLFTSDRSGTTDVWAINTSDKAQNAVHKRVVTNIGDIEPVGFTLDGSLFYLILTHSFESFIVPLKSSNGDITINERTPIAGKNQDICWLPDGESLIGSKLVEDPNNTPRLKLFIYKISTGVSDILAGDLNIFGQSRISPDGKSVLVFGFEQKRSGENNYEGGIYVVDIKTGTVDEIKVNQEIGSGSCTYDWAKDGKNIYYTANNQIILHNIESGEEKTLYNEKPFSFPNIIRSYDGNDLLADIMVDRNNADCQLLRIPLNGDDAQLIFTHKDVSAIRFKRMALSPQGNYIYFTSLAKGLRAVLYRIPEPGGAPEKLWQSKNCFLPGLSIHPGGNKIALSTYQPGAELRLIENLGNGVNKSFAKEE